MVDWVHGPENDTDYPTPPTQSNFEISTVILQARRLTEVERKEF